MRFQKIRLHRCLHREKPRTSVKRPYFMTFRFSIYIYVYMYTLGWQEPDPPVLPDFSNAEEPTREEDFI